MSVAALMWVSLTAWIAVVTGVSVVVLVMKDRSRDVAGMVVGAVMLVVIIAVVLGGDR